jgi:hypothetical protein
MAKNHSAKRETADRFRMADDPGMIGKGDAGLRDLSLGGA